MQKKLLLACVLLLAHASPCSANNTAYGTAAGTALTTGTDNTILGTEAGVAVTTGTDNTLLGYEAGYGVTGSHNIILGEDPSSAITSGSSNILIGNSLSGLTNSSNYQLNVGNVITGTGLGTPSTSLTAIQGNLDIYGGCTGCSGYANKLRNSAVLVGTRGTSGTISTAGQAYTVDGVICSTTGANVTWNQEGPTDYEGAADYLYILGATSNTDVTCKFRIEADDMAPFPGGTGTFSVWFRNTGGGNLTPTITTQIAGATNNFGSLTTDLSTSNMQTVTSGSNNHISYTFSLGATAYQGYEIDLDMGPIAGSAKTLILSQWDFRLTPGVATGLNSNPPAPENRPIGDEYPRDLRYLGGFGETTGIVGSCYATSTTAFGCWIPFKTHMYAAPTGLTVGTVGDLEIVNMAGTNIAAVSALSFSKASRDGIFLTGTVSSGLTSGTVYQLSVATALTGNVYWTGGEL